MDSERVMDSDDQEKREHNYARKIQPLTGRITESILLIRLDMLILVEKLKEFSPW